MRFNEGKPELGLMTSVFFIKKSESWCRKVAGFIMKKLNIISPVIMCV